MLLRLAYLGITNAFTLLQLLPGTDRDKDAEIPAFATNSRYCTANSAAHHPLDPRPGAALGPENPSWGYRRAHGEPSSDSAPKEGGRHRLCGWCRPVQTGYL